MTTPREGWRAQLEPAAWVTCRVTPVEGRHWDGRPDGGTWLHAEPAETAATDAFLTILAGWGGGGKYDHTEVIETAQAVYILVFIEHWVPAVPEPGVMYVRTLELQRALIEVHLAHPVGARNLVGSVGRASSRAAPLGADGQPIDTVSSVRPPEASPQGRDLIAHFAELLSIKATHESVADMQGESESNVPHRAPCEDGPHLPS